MERTTLGHLALHYAEGDEALARRLLTLLGCTLVDNGPNPGHDGFCTVLLDADSATHADNIMFLSRLSPAQVALEDAIREQLGIGTADQAEPVTAFAAVEGAHAGARRAHRHPLRVARGAGADARCTGGRVGAGWLAARPRRAHEVPRPAGCRRRRRRADGRVAGVHRRRAAVVRRLTGSSAS